MRTNKLKWLIRTDWGSIPIIFYNQNRGRDVALEICRSYAYGRAETPDDLKRKLRQSYIRILPFGGRGVGGYHKIPVGEDY
jgi:hypothetical protein